LRIDNRLEFIHKQLVTFNYFVAVVLGMRSADFPKELSAQNMKATSMVHELIKRVLGREESFTLSVRKGSGVVRYARDSTMLLVPPVEVTYDY
jgi:hypothetical protein